MEAKNKLIVALDVPNFDEARKLTDILGDSVDIYKIGIQLFTACGPVIVRNILAQGKKVFLDLKFHDIPNTVANAISSVLALNTSAYDVLDKEGQKVVKDIGALLMCTIHTSGGFEMMKRASDVLKEYRQKTQINNPKLVGITVLTSEMNKSNITEIVLQRASLAKQAGLDGVVASAQEAAIIRKEVGEDFIIVTPGIRPKGSDSGDQKRVTTPYDAISAGSDYLVVGRPIVKNSNPLKASEDILKEIQLALNKK